MSTQIDTSELREKINQNLTIEALHKNKLHLGHSASYRNPMMSSMIHAIRHGVCIINLVKTHHYLSKSLAYVEKVVSKGGTILFVGTKPTARDTITELAQSCDMPYINHRWLGGMLTNFKTVKQSISRLKKLTSMLEDGTIDKLTKKEALMKRREIDKLEKTLGGIKNLTRLPDAIVIIDVGYEDIAVKEANKLGIPVVGVVDTNNDPRNVQFVIPANDDAIRSIRHIVELFTQTVELAKPLKKSQPAPKAKESKPAERSEKKSQPAKASSEKPAPSEESSVTSKDSSGKKISAADVKKLRESTGFAMMDCKKALVEAEGDFEKASQILAQTSKKKMQKKASRIAAEGVITFAQGENFNSMVEINCETDFVARDANFLEFKSLVEQAAQQVPQQQVDTLLEQVVQEKSLGQHLEDVISKVGENITIRRIATIAQDESTQASYNHGGKMAAMVSIDGADRQVARDLAMHIAAMNPQYVDLSLVPAQEMKEQEDILVAQVANEDKTDEIKAKIVQARLAKHFEALCLMDQSYIKNPDLTVKQFLQESGATLKSFIRYEVGEGIEKVETDFASEVMAQVKG